MVHTFERNKTRSYSFLLLLLFSRRDLTGSLGSYGLQRYSFCCCCCSIAEIWLALWDPMGCGQAFLSCTVSWAFLKFMFTVSVTPSNHLFLCCPLLLLPSIFPSSRVFSNEPILRIRWPEYWSFSFSICPSNEHPGLISFRMDWLDLLAVQGTLKSLLHHSPKAYFTFYSILVGTKFTWLNITPLNYPRRDRNKGKL